MKSLSRIAAYGLLLASTCHAGIALAQAAPAVNAPPIRSPLDDNGVNLATGGLELAAPQLSIGAPGASGLAHVRYWEGNGWRHGFFMVLDPGPTGSTKVTVSIGNASTTFTVSGSSYTADQSNGATLTSNTTSYIYTAADGTVYVFDKSYSGGIYYSTGTFGVPATSVTLTSGEKITLSYGSYTQSTGLGSSIRFTRLQSVNSSAGYQLKFGYQSSSYQTISQVIAINNAVDYCNPTADSCTGLTQTWPSVSYATATSGSNTVESVTDPMGRVTQYTTNSASQLIGIRRPGSSTDDETIGYDGNGRVSSVIKDGSTWTYVWSLSGTTLMATITDPAGNKRTTTADASQLVVLTDRDGNGNTTTTTPDASGRVQTVKTPLGRSTVYGYDARGNVTKVQIVAAGSTAASCGAASNATCLVATAAYPTSFTSAATYNKPTSTTDANGNTTSYGYDTATGFVTSVTAPTGGGVTLKQVYGYTPLYAYYHKDGSGSIAAADAPIVKPTSSSVCRTAASCAGSANETDATIGYGPQTAGTANNLLPVSTTVAAGDGSLAATTGAGYDIFGNQASATDPNGQTTLYRHDADRALTGSNGPDPDGSGALKSRAVTIHYLADGILDTVTQGTSNADGSGFASLQQVATSYDAADRPVQGRLTATGVSTPYAITQRNYDAVGLPDCTVLRMNTGAYGSPPSPTTACYLGTTGSYGPDRIHNEDHDPAGRLSQSWEGFGTAASAQTIYSYTADDALATVTDPNGNVTSYTYDGFDRLVKTQYPNPSGGGSSASDTELLTLDANGNVTQRQLRDGKVIGYTYDALDRVIAKDLPAGENDVTYAYDNLGHLTQANRPVDGVYVTLGWDALGRLTSDTQPFGRVAYKYDLAGNRTRLTWQDGQYVRYDYDYLGEMVSIKENGSTSLATYTYDDLGRRVSRTLGNGQSASYGWDGASNLTSLSLTGSSSGTTVTFSGYDPAGEIGSRTNSNDLYAFTQATNANKPYAPDGLNRYASVAGTAQTYDLRGNLTSTGSASYGYTSENLLSSAPSNGVTLGYDTLGRLAEYDTTVSTRMVSDGGRISEEVANPSGAVLRRYVPGAGADETVVWYEGSGTSDKRWLDQDERGSVTRIKRDDGTTLAINSYDEFGTPASTNQGRFGYTGQAWLPEAGVYDYKARMYAPALGRFLQTDPIGYGDGTNWYDYVSGNPVNRTDPDGTDWGEDIVVQGNRLPGPSCSYATFCQTYSPWQFAGIGTAPIHAAPTGGGAAATTPQKDPNEIVVTAKKSKNCGLGSALANNGQALIGDAIGFGASFLPGGKPAVALAGLALGSGLLANTASTANSSRPGLSIGSLAVGITSFHVTSAGPLAEAYKATSSIARNLPLTGSLLAAGALAIDAVNVYEDYTPCGGQ